MKTVNTNKSSALPSLENNPIEWLRKNFFSTWHNSLLSLILFSLILWGVINFISWAKTEAEWQEALDELGNEDIRKITKLI